MSQYRYELDKGNKKYHCPEANCGKKTLVRYKDKITGNYLPEQYGRCDREVKCAYHLNPYLDGYAKMIWVQERGLYSGNWKPQRPINRPKSAPKPEPVFIPVEILKETLRPDGYVQNVFIQNLLTRISFPFEIKDVEKVISQYYLGTVCNGYRAGSITFPFIDKNQNVRAVQVKQFDDTNHTTGTDFLHSIIEKQHHKKNEALPDWLVSYQKNEIKVSCLFGEHFLSKYTLNPIALVEAPKTAIYGTLYFGFPERPENLLWLAVYNLSSLNFDKCKALQGRDVFLFPDLSKDGKAFELWNNKAKELNEPMPSTRYKVSDLLETLAPKELKESGADIADILIKMDWRKFRQQEKAIQKIEQPITKPIPPTDYEKGENSEALEQTFFSDIEPLSQIDLLKNESSEQSEKLGWDQEIKELELFYNTITLPSSPVQLNDWSKITDVSIFIQSQLILVKANNGKRPFLPDLLRLQELMKYLSY